MSSFDVPAYPPLRDAADIAAARAQTLFVALTFAQLLVLSGVAFCSGLSSKDVHGARTIAIASSCFIFLALGITSALRTRKLDDRWFRCRAYAENFKGAVWRFAMASEATPSENVQTYLDQIEQLGGRLPDLQHEFTRFGGSGSLITTWMDEFASLPLAAKLPVYRKLRIEDQIAWYTAKSVWNAKLESLMFASIFVLEFATLAIAVVQAWLMLPFNMTGVLATLGTCMVAWTQLRRYSDLETSYSIAAIDLRRLAEKHRNVTSQEETNVLVAEVEVAVSREHSMWLAKRVPTAC